MRGTGGSGRIPPAGALRKSAVLARRFRSPRHGAHRRPIKRRGGRMCAVMSRAIPRCVRHSVEIWRSVQGVPPGESRRERDVSNSHGRWREGSPRPYGSSRFCAANRLQRPHPLVPRPDSSGGASSRSAQKSSGNAPHSLSKTSGILRGDQQPVVETRTTRGAAASATQPSLIATLHKRLGQNSPRS